MINEQSLIQELSKAIEDSDFNIDSTVDNTENWDSLGQLSILATLAKLTGGKSDSIPEIALAQSMYELLDVLRNHGIVE